MQKKEILQIEDEVLRKLAIAYLEVGVPEYFWEIPASLSGLYHPIQDHGPQGLLRHTRMCMTIAIDLLNLDMYQSLAQYKDEILIALLIHDSWKCGVSKRFVKRSGMEEWCTIHAHPKIAAQKFSDFVSQFKDIDEVTIEKCKEICKCAETHMGQSNSLESDRIWYYFIFISIEIFFKVAFFTETQWTHITTGITLNAPVPVFIPVTRGRIIFFQIFILEFTG